MLTPSSRARRRSQASRITAALACVVSAGALLAAVAPASADPPVNPSDSQIQSAAQQKQALAGQVGDLSAQVSQIQAQVERLKAASELAEQKQALAIQQREIATQKAKDAQERLAAARKAVDAARKRFVAYVQAAYTTGTMNNTTGILLTASDPSTMLSQSTLQDYQASHQISAVGQMQRASVEVSNAEAAARKTLQEKTKAEAAAKVAAARALEIYQSNLAQQKTLESNLAATQNKLESAKLKLATLNNQRQKYLAYVAEQKRIAEEKRRAAEAAARRAAQLAAARAAAARSSGSSSSSGGGSSSSGGGSSPVSSTPSAPSGGSWTAAKGQAAVHRAMQYLGYMYAWAGGNYYGPTYGVCVAGAAWNDCHIDGFDCSGLTLYAWAPYVHMAHYTVTQYLSFGYHPSLSNLMPGDLVFWSSNGTVSGIHHVALYIGNGQVIQAPESGSVIQITGLYNVSYGLYGAVRPLT